jgi:hypothetical protein
MEFLTKPEARLFSRACRALAMSLAVFVALAARASDTSASSSAPPAAASEYQIKAVFLFNFAQFVDWPPSVFASPDAPFCIGVLGDDPFGENLDEVVRGEHVGNRPIVVKRVRQVEDVEHCQMLYISRSESRQLGSVLARVRERPILTVADLRGFAENGGIIGFVMEANRVRLHVNLEAAQTAQLKISSKLLRTAQLVSAQ